MKRPFLVIVVIAFSLAAAAAASQNKPAQQDPHFAKVPARDHARANPLAGKSDALAAGASLYQEHCAECHKADARGDGAKRPSLRSPAVVSATDGDLEWFLRQGDLRHGMPSWSSLTQAQRWALVAYLRSLK